MTNKRNWELIKRRTLLKEPFIEVERRIYSNPLAREKCKIQDYSIVTFSKDGTVAVVALTTQNQVLLLRQYRPAADKWVVNLPGGRTDKHGTPEESVRHELESETGYTAKNLEKVFETFQNPTRVTDKSIIFSARDVSFDNSKRELEGAEEGLELLVEDFEGVVEFLISGKSEKLRNLTSEDTFDVVTTAALLIVYQRMNKKS